MKRALHLIGISVLALAAALVAMTMLPHSPYVRWQSLRSESFARLGWIYERAHFDPTPTDVVFLGTSHTLNGVDAQAVAEGLGLGLRNAEDGRCPTATNVAMPTYGRNLHWLIAREILETRNVEVLVIEVLENESRKPHEAFIYAANVGDVLNAPKFFNLNAAGDLARLPLRQLTLALKSAAPAAYGLKPRFELSAYDGSTVDNTRIAKVGGVALTPLRASADDPADLKLTADRYAAIKNLNFLPKRFEGLEYAVPNRYVDEILDLAERKGAKVVFMYLPGYGRPDKPYATTLYQGRGEMIFPATDLLTDQALWYDVDHLNIDGARRLSERLLHLIAPALEAKGWGSFETNAVACSNGYPERGVTLPYRSARVG